MNYMTMSFGDITWQANPTALKLQMGRALRETALPFAGSRLEDLGAKKRRVSGEGWFTGPDRLKRWQELSAVFAEGGAKFLQLPGQAPFLAVLEELRLLGEPGGDHVHYSFLFTEHRGPAGYKGGKAHRACAGESLWDYAARYEIPIEELHRVNLHIRDIACLEQGEEVRIP